MWKTHISDVTFTSNETFYGRGGG